MSAENLADTDPIPRVTAWLEGHPAVVDALGGADRVGPYNRPPYPRLRLVEVPGGGDDRSLQWLISVEVQIEAYGDLDGSPGKEALRRLLYTALGALMELPDVPAPPGAPVVTTVRATRSGGWAPEPSGQPRYIAAVRVYVHP